MHGHKLDLPNIDYKTQENTVMICGKNERYARSIIGQAGCSSIAILYLYMTYDVL